MTRNTFEPKGAPAMTTDTHGRDQAAALAASVANMVASLNCDFDRLQELRDERENLSETLADQEIYDLVKEAAAALAAWDDDNAAELNDLEHAAGDYADQDDASARIQEDALSVEVRSAWDVAGGNTAAAEFRIVLCTGGPHVEIVGELDQHQQPARAWMQYQDWGTPLTQYFDIEQSTLLAYCQEFYFGE